jgi:ribonuclease D
MRNNRPVDNLPAPVLVNTSASYEKMMAHLAQCRLISVDTESDSLYSYATKVCLLQISVLTEPPTPGIDPDWLAVTDYLVDPLRVEIDSLGRLMASPDVEVVMHAAENDILTLHREAGFTFGRIFDTQLAARILGWSGVGLAPILEREYGVISNKKMQRTNWGQRPLTAEQIAYAQVDSRYLLDLRARLIKELESAGRWEEAQEAFDFLAKSSHEDRPPTPRTVWSMKTTRGLAYDRMGLLEELWLWREQEAERRDRPPFKIVGDKVLMKILEIEPTRRDQLANIPGLSDHLLRRYGETLVQAVRRGQSRPLPPFPNGNHDEPRLEGAVLARFDALRRWRTATAQARGVDPDIVFSNDILTQIAWQVPTRIEDLLTIPAIGPWKAATYGPEILQIVARKG